MDEARIVTNSKIGTQICSLFFLYVNCPPMRGKKFRIITVLHGNVPLTNHYFPLLSSVKKTEVFGHQVTST